jgi:hypothetical protein
MGGASDWPTLHLTRFDFADLWPAQLPFAVLPNGRPESTLSRDGLSLVIRQKWAEFNGSVTITHDAAGTTRIEYDFVYTGTDFYAREIGLRLPFAGHDWRLAWDRWSEWGDAPQDSIMRRRGEATPFRGRAPSRTAESTPPRWSWLQDETSEGASDFRSVKLNILEASLNGPRGGLTVYGRADVHVRAAVEGPQTALYVLTRCAIGPRPVLKGERLCGVFTVAASRR